MKYAFDKFNINIYDVINAYQKFIWLLCPFIPVLVLVTLYSNSIQFYFSWKSKKLGFKCNFIELSEKINSGVPKNKIIKKI